MIINQKMLDYIRQNLSLKNIRYIPRDDGKYDLYMTRADERLAKTPRKIAEELMDAAKN